MMAVPFSTDSEEVIHRELLAHPHTANLQPEQWKDYFEVERCCHWIIEHQFTRVALQFPDEYLPRSTDVCKYIKDETNAQVFILADTSYGSCCVDEVSASHYTAEAIIHYGHTCLSPCGRLPILYIFGKGAIDVNDCCEKFKTAVSDPAKILVVLSVEYSHVKDEVEKRLSRDHTEVLICDIVLHEAKLPDSIGDNQNSQSIFQMFRRQFTLPPGDSMKDFIILYIGQESMALTNMMMEFTESVLYSYNPRTEQCRKETVNVNKLLMKRFYLVEKVKDSQIVGILIATLSVSRYLEIVNRLKKLLSHAGKKYYIFSVGKINVPKLANFPDVDVYVLVSCPESVILDSSDYYCPIVTPYEVEMACDPQRQWAGKLVLDYASLLPGGCNHQSVDLTKQVDETDVSLITGSLRQMGSRHTDDDPTDTTVAKRDPMTLTTVSGERFTSKAWQGLEPQLGQTEVTKAIQGRKGVAIQYEEEPS